MTGLGFLLAKVRKAPEPLKQRLRPVFFHTFSFVRSAPGGRHLARLLVRAAPNLHGWLRLRFEAYHVLKLVKAGPTSPVLAGERLLPPDALAPTEATVYRRMASRLAAGR